MNNRRFFYDTIADRFDELHNEYDLKRRLSVVYEELLPLAKIRGRNLDLGCGSGWFSKKANEHDLRIISLDISPNLTRITKNRASSNALVADAINLPFSDNSFELIISSEMIEHLIVVEDGLREISRILSPGGVLILTTPNRRWLWMVNLATKLKLRPYDGFENFLHFDQLACLLKKYDLKVEVHLGLHPWPFQLTPLQGLSTWVDKHFGMGRWGKWMINQAVLARKNP